MRSYYLHSRYDKDHQCDGMRGGVAISDVVGIMGDEYELEIGNNANASPEMIALCCMHDEIIEFLELSPTVLSEALLDMYNDKMAEINQRYADNKKARDDGEKLKAFKDKYNE